MAPTDVGPTTLTGCAAKTPREPCKKRVPELQSGPMTALGLTSFALKIKGLQIGIDFALDLDGIVSVKGSVLQPAEGGPR
jgi:hypothetical protein